MSPIPLALQSLRIAGERGHRTAFAWDDEGWRAPPWPTAVIYELHVGTFTAEGTFAALAARLEHLAHLVSRPSSSCRWLLFRHARLGLTTACCRTPRRLVRYTAGAEGADRAHIAADLR